MGEVIGITSTEFPESTGNEGRCEFKEFPFGNLFATIVRQDAVEPHGTVWRIDQGLNREAYATGEVIYIHSQIIESYADNPEMLNLRSALKGEYCYEGKPFYLCFNYDSANKCSAICIFDRGPETMFQITSGPHEGKFISAHECQYQSIVDEREANANIPKLQTRYVGKQRARTLRRRGESVWWDSAAEKFAWEFFHCSPKLYPWQRNVLRSVLKCKSKTIVIDMTGVTSLVDLERLKIKELE